MFRQFKILLSKNHLKIFL